MSCKICGRGSCTECFHSLEDQEEFDRLSEIYGSGKTLNELRTLEEEDE